ncbi:transposase [Paenibacillus sp. OAE614]|uniref:transposase n=1 Tax=Paenibacillus sp. OAE614 TaxID=2663804 RepID=UPI00178ABF4C
MRRRSPALRIAKWKLTYDAESNTYICPEKHQLTYRTTDRKDYRQYASDPELCKTCPMHAQCTHSRNHLGFAIAVCADSPTSRNKV